jgi:hypothetical protein
MNGNTSDNLATKIVKDIIHSPPLLFIREYYIQILLVLVYIFFILFGFPAEGEPREPIFTYTNDCTQDICSIGGEQYVLKPEVYLRSESCKGYECNVDKCCELRDRCSLSWMDVCRAEDNRTDTDYCDTSQCLRSECCETPCKKLEDTDDESPEVIYQFNCGQGYLLKDESNNIICENNECSRDRCCTNQV